VRAFIGGLTATVVLAVAFVSACSRVDETPAGNTPAITFRSSGVLKNIDTEGRSVTIDHEEIEGYMAAMEMTWPVRDRVALDGLSLGDRVDFEIETVEASTFVTTLTKTGEVALVNGAEVFKLNCSKCHGDKGEGSKKGIPLISGHALNHSELEYVQRVSDGKEGKMPAFRNKLSADEIKAVVEYVRGTLQSGLPHDTAHQH
jgi:mono/diheme cytochrome c family protein